MKNLRRFCAAAVLTSVLAFSAFAGDISCPGVIPPPQPLMISETDTPGATSTGETSVPGEVALDPVTEAALGLLQNLLSLF